MTTNSSLKTTAWAFDAMGHQLWCLYNMRSRRFASSPRKKLLPASPLLRPNMVCERASFASEREQRPCAQMVLPFALWAPLVLLAVMILVPVHAVDTTTRVGVFLAGMFAEMDVHETMPALSWAGVAIRLRLTTVGDLLDALDRAGSEWADFTSEAMLLSVGVPLVAAATVNVVLLFKLRALRSNPNPFLVNDTEAPAAKRVRTAHHRVMRDEVLPKELTDLAAVLARLRMTIAQYEFCMRKQQARAGGFVHARNWKARHITWKYWNYCELVHLRQLEAIATLLLERDGEFVKMAELFLVAWRIGTQGARTSARAQARHIPQSLRRGCVATLAPQCKTTSTEKEWLATTTVSGTFTCAQPRQPQHAT